MKPLIEYLREAGLAELPLRYGDEPCKAVVSAVNGALNERPVVFGLELEKEVDALGKPLDDGRGLYWGAVTSESSNPYLKHPKDFHRSKLNEELERIAREKVDWREFELRMNIGGVFRGRGKRINGSAIYYRDRGKMSEFLASRLDKKPITIYTFGIDF